MRLYESEGKELFRTYGIPVPQSVLLKSGDTLPEYSMVLKAQVRSGDRMKAGGILFAKTRTDGETAFSKLLSSTINGEPVEEVLIEEYVEAKNE